MAVNIIRKFLMKKLMKPDAEGIMKIPEKGRIDFSEHFLKEKLFTNGIDDKLIKNERQLVNILDSIDQAETRKLKQEAERLGLNKPKKSGEVIEVDFDKGRWSEAGGFNAADDVLVEQMYRTSSPRNLEYDSSFLAEFIAEDAGKVLDDLPIEEQTKFIERAKNALKRNVDQYRDKKASGGKAKESWTDKLVRWGGGPSMLAGELGIEGLNQIYHLLQMPGLYNKGGRAGIGYLLAEDTNERMPYEAGKKVGRPKGMSIPYRIGGGEYTIDPDFDELGADEWFKIVKAAMAGDYGALEYAKGGRSGYAGGGSGKPPIDFYVDFSASGGKEGQNIYGIEGLNEKGYDYGGTFGADTTFPFFGGELSIGGEFGIGRNKSNVDYKGHPIDWLSNVGETKIGDSWNVGAKWRKPFAGGGMTRRGFLKLMAALGLTGAAAKSGLVTLFKKSTPKIAKDLTSIPIKNAEGMPSWFKPLVNRVIKEGVETTKLAPNKGGAYLDRQIVHSAKLGEEQGVRVYQDLDTQTIRVEYQSADNMGGVDDVVHLEYKAPEVLEGPIKKGQPTTTKAEFSAEEAYPHNTTDDYKDITFEGSNVVTKVDDLYSDTSALKQFGTNKALNKKELEIAKQKRKRVNEINNDLGEQNSLLPEPPDPDFASGGLAKLLGE